MHIPPPEGPVELTKRIDLSSATANDFARIASPAIRRLAAQVARELQAAAGEPGRANVVSKALNRSFAKGF